MRAKFDDGGFSGGTMNRPALQELLEAVEQGKVDIIVVYKVDRLTRSLADFAKIVELFDDKGVSFVSVKDVRTTHTQALLIRKPGFIAKVPARRRNCALWATL